jgi:hypothetical protein
LCETRAKKRHSCESAPPGIGIPAAPRRIDLVKLCLPSHAAKPQPCGSCHQRGGFQTPSRAMASRGDYPFRRSLRERLPPRTRSPAQRVPFIPSQLIISITPPLRLLHSIYIFPTSTRTLSNVSETPYILPALRKRLITAIWRVSTSSLTNAFLRERIAGPQNTTGPHRIDYFRKQRSMPSSHIYAGSTSMILAPVNT